MVDPAALTTAAGPLVSICIANYNGVDILPDCLSSVYAQRGAIDVEIIIHDDASTDASVQLIQRDHPAATLIVSAENVGFCVANNRMVERARGRYVLLLNNDAALFPDALETLVREAESAEVPSVLTLAQFDWESGALVDRGCLLDYSCTPVPNRAESRVELAYVIGACLFTTRTLWDSLGGFPAWMESIGEDLYLGCLARLRGAQVRCASGSGYRHRQGASFGGNRQQAGRVSSTYRRRHYSERNRAATLAECTPTPLAWVLLTLHLVSLLIEGIVLCVMLRSWQPWLRIYGPAIGYVLGNLGAIRARRRRVQATRRISLWRYFSAFTPMPRKLSMLLEFGWPRLR